MRTLLIGLAASLLANSSTAQKTQPNIVLIVADDLGYADFGAHGGRDIPTPALDELARSGVRFTQAYVSAPVCAPTRAGLLTGRYQQRFGFEYNMEVRNQGAGLPVTEMTIAQRLKPAGYHTALIGKWHLGNTAPYHPLERGFDEFFGFLGGIHSYVSAGEPGPLWDGRQRAELTGYLTDMLTDRAVDYIKRQSRRPFFLYLAYNAPHEPMQAPPSYLKRVGHIGDDHRRTYAAMVTALDDGIARVMKALSESGLDRNTLVIFFNDNGGPVLGHGPILTDNGSSNAPLRGAKWRVFEGGVRVPFLMRWPGRLGQNLVEHRPIIQLDVLPTALAAAGVNVDPAWQLDGVDLLPFLLGQREDAPHPALYWRFGPQAAVRQGQWKLVHEPADKLALMMALGKPNDWSKAELFDLSADPGELNNLAAANPAKVKELAALWQRWNQQLVEPLWNPYTW